MKDEDEEEDLDETSNLDNLDSEQIHGLGENLLRDLEKFSKHVSCVTVFLGIVAASRTLKSLFSVYYFRQG